MGKRYFAIYWIWIITCLCPLRGAAQQVVKPLKNEFQFSTGLNSYLAFEFEPSYSYRLLKNIGIVGSIRAVTEVVENLHYDLVGGLTYQWRISRKEKAAVLLFRPALRFKFPLVSDCLFITMEPGLLINPIPDETLEFASINTETFEIPSNYKTVKNKGGRVFFYEVKNYLALTVDNWSLLAGYNLSTYDLYSGRRNIVIEGDLLNKHLTSKKAFCHTGFIGIGYSF
ncbi:hypothetical protein [Parabacteroides sp. Marseille-P3160]|uniref:hypothetical protein n=1 Tax=Parabacteroides sp. Marseille-P3160 TaxID=1917887 RepID=UPI0009BB7E86|nr:hypothetical protein [Parabacteroides sp. Marseille-P3160]